MLGAVAGTHRGCMRRSPELAVRGPLEVRGDPVAHRARRVGAAQRLRDLAEQRVIRGRWFLIQHVGTQTAQARAESEASGAVLKQATNNRDSVSAVNLDEEAANLMKFEQYYNASAQVIQIARSIFDTLISSIR